MVVTDSQLAIAYTMYNRNNYKNGYDTNFKDTGYRNIVSALNQYDAVYDTVNKNSYYPDVNSDGWKNAVTLAELLCNGKLEKAYDSPIDQYASYRADYDFIKKHSIDEKTGQHYYYMGKPCKITEPIQIGKQYYFNFIYD